MENDEITDCTLFVGDLSRDVSKDDLYNLFEMVGVVHEAVVKCSNVTGQPMGYGFVRMATRDDAEHALQALAGMNLKGRCIRVGRAERNCRLIVKNLDRSVRFEELLHIFLPYGSLQMYDSGQEVSGKNLEPFLIYFSQLMDFVRVSFILYDVLMLREQNVIFTCRSFMAVQCMLNGIVILQMMSMNLDILEMNLLFLFMSDS